MKSVMRTRAALAGCVLVAAAAVWSCSVSAPAKRDAAASGASPASTVEAPATATEVKDVRYTRNRPPEKESARRQRLEDVAEGRPIEDDSTAPVRAAPTPEECADQTTTSRTAREDIVTETAPGHGASPDVGAGVRYPTGPERPRKVKEPAAPPKRPVAVTQPAPTVRPAPDPKPVTTSPAPRPRHADMPSARPAPYARPRPASWQELASSSDELWVIARSEPKSRRPQSKRKPYAGQGELRAKLDEGGAQKEIALPLEHTDVKAEVSAFVATVNVTQKYRNPYGQKIEAVYVFPLPQDAAVTDFVMTIGTRRIRGIIREREEATRVYNNAKRQGYTAALLTQERPNIFTQRVANIEPRKRIDVTITYFNTLAYSKGEYEFVFPMVVGPRYNPPGWTDPIAATGHGKPGKSGAQTEVQYLRPGTRSGHDIAVTVDIDAGVEIEEVRSPSHAVDVKRADSSRVSVTLSPNDTIPNKDLVLRYRVAGSRLKTALMTTKTDRSGHFALVLQPPALLADCPRTPREMVFVLDCSGSMNGWPIRKAKEAMRRCLRKLGPDDTFQIIRFSQNASKFGRAPVAATRSNIRRALSYVDGLHGHGGTRMLEGVKTALDFPHDPKRFRIVSFMTDGYIGNEAQILAAIHQKLGDSRIFSFGVGSSVNRYLIEGMARVGRGAAAFVMLDESAVDAVDRFYDRCSRMALTDVKVDFGGMEADDVYPKRLPDLFVGRPVLVTGAYRGTGPVTVRVSGRLGGERVAYTVSANLDDAGARHDGIAKVWARRKLRHLADIATRDPSNELKREMIDVSLLNSVQCRHTAFVAVDTSRRTEGESGVTVSVPVPVPFGVKYETTVSD